MTFSLFACLLPVVTTEMAQTIAISNRVRYKPQYLMEKSAPHGATPSVLILLFSFRGSDSVGNEQSNCLVSLSKHGYKGTEILAERANLRKKNDDGSEKCWKRRLAERQDVSGWCFGTMLAHRSSLAQKGNGE